MTRPAPGLYGEPRFVAELPGHITTKTAERRAKIRELMGKIKTKPGAWAEIASFDTDHGATGMIKALRESDKLPTDQWELATRRVAGKSSRLFMRYIGPVPPGGGR